MYTGLIGFPPAVLSTSSPSGGPVHERTHARTHASIRDLRRCRPSAAAAAAAAVAAAAAARIRCRRALLVLVNLGSTVFGIIRSSRCRAYRTRVLLTRRRGLCANAKRDVAETRTGLFFFIPVNISVRCRGYREGGPSFGIAVVVVFKFLSYLRRDERPEDAVAAAAAADVDFHAVADRNPINNRL